MELCPTCRDSAGRSWWLLDGDVYCGLCGQAVRDVEVRAAPAPDGGAERPAGAGAGKGGAKPPGLTWLVAAGANDGAAVASLVVKNTGTLPVRVSAIEAPRTPACRATFADKELLRHDSLAVTVTMSGPPQQYPRELELIVRGNFPAKTVRLAVGPAPGRFVARPADADEWSRRAAAARDARAESSGALRNDAGGAAGQLGWDLGELILAADGKGRAVLDVAPDRRSWTGRVLPPAAAGDPGWEGPAGVSVRVVAAAGPSSAGGDGGPAARDGAEVSPYRLEVNAGRPVTGEVAGAVVLRLDALGGPAVRVPVRLVAGRPEWRCQVDQVRQRSITLPYGCPSVLYATCTPVATGGATGGTGIAGAADDADPTTVAAEGGAGDPEAADSLGRLIDEYRLEVSAGDAPGAGPAVRVRVQRLGPPLVRGATPGDLRFRILVIPPPRPGSFELSARLVGVIDGRRAELSAPDVLQVNAVDTRDPRVLDPRGGYRLVVDFGTTYTCIGRADPHHAFPNKCQPLRERPGPVAGSGGAAAASRERPSDDMIPTVLWLRETDVPGKPQCLIGLDADGQGPPGAGTAVFRLFKPDIADKAEHEMTGPTGARHTYYAKDFARLFLRELLTEVRAQLGQAVIQDFYVTCPATFTAKQRHELQNVLARLRKCGIVREADLLLDEANAGAFRDLDTYLSPPAPEAPSAPVASDDPDAAPTTDAPAAAAAPPPPPHVDAMILDFGGGTIDIAALHARRRSGDKVIYDLRPLGITGLRDFGGKHVTDALARHLAKRLATHLYVPRPGKDGKAGEPVMKMSRAPWLPLPPSVTAGIVGHRQDVLDIAEENYQFLHALAEEVKTRFYGAWPAALRREEQIHIPPDDPTWWDKLEQRLTPGLIDKMSGGHIGARFRMFDEPTSRQPGDPPQVRNVEAREWRKWLADCAITRQELDDLITPALEEAFERARRLWNEARAASDPTSLSAPYQPPDLFLLAGGSSQLPLVWKLAAKAGDRCLGFPAHRIRFSESEAKRKVALGGALYARVRRGEADVAIKPEDTLQFLLIPIVYEIQGRRYERIFPTGYRVTEPGEPQPRLHQPDDNGELEVVIYENVDYRYGPPWELPKRLQDLGMHARGKEPLAQFFLQFPGSERAEVVYRVLRNGLARTMRLEFKGKDGPDQREEQI